MSFARARENETIEQVKIGNLAVDGTMQPVPFIGFGENIISKHETLGSVFPSWLSGKNQTFVDIVSDVLYGIRDDLSIILGFPTAVSYRQEDNHSSGFSDLLIQFEYAFYETQTKASTNELTVVASVFLPTGNECKTPPIGSGSPTFFLGVTASHLDTEWYCYTSYGVFLRTQRDDNIKIGNRFVYEGGFGKNIAYSSDKWMLMWMVEIAGIYNQKSKINGVVDKDSGSNQILIGPSLWFSTQRWIIQGGIAPIVSQHSFEPKDSFFAAFSVSYRFT